MMKQKLIVMSADALCDADLVDEAPTFAKLPGLGLKGADGHALNLPAVQ